MHVSTQAGTRSSSRQGPSPAIGWVRPSQPVGLQVVVVGAGGVAGLAGEHLPARALGRGRVGDHAPARRPDGFVGVVGVVGDLADRLLGAAGAEAAVEQAVAAAGWPRRAGAGTPSRGRWPQRQPSGSGPKRSPRSSRAPRQRLQHELVPGPADQLLVAFLPELHQVRVPAPGRGDVRGEAVVGAVEPALAEVAVADRARGRPRAPGAAGRPGRSCRRSSPGRAARPSCAAARSRCSSRWPRGRQAAEPPRRLEPGQREVVGLHRLEALEVVLVARPQQLLDPLGAEAVEPVAGDVVRVVVADDAVVGGDEEAALGVDRPPAARRRGSSPPTRTRRSSPASAGRGSRRVRSGRRPISL